MRKLVEEYLKLQSAWSEDNITEEQMTAMMKAAQPLKDKFTRADWEELIKITHNIHAKIAWTKIMNKKFPPAPSAPEEDPAFKAYLEGK